MSNLQLFISVTISISFILIVTQICGRLITLIGQPKVVGEMISGVLLGPTCFGYFFPELSETLFSKTILPYLYIIGNFGLVIYMFLIGINLDLKQFSRKLVQQSSIVSISTIVLPLICGALISSLYYDVLSAENTTYFFFSLFVGTALAITAFPMMARILEEKKLLQTKFGAFIMLSAAFQDVISWILLAFVISIAKNEGIAHGYIALVAAFVLVLVAIFILRPLFKKIGNAVENNGELSLNQFSIIIISLLVAALITDHYGLYSVFGGFILGLSMPRNEVFKKQLNTRLNYITLGFALPLFFTFSGLNTDLGILTEMTYFVPCVLILAVAFASKYLSCLFSMKISGYSWRESSATGGLMNARGLMELIITNIGLTYGIINKQFYSILILVAIVTTLGALPIFNVSLRKKEIFK